MVSRANTLADWRGWTAFIGLQVPYSLARRHIERELLPMAGSLGLSVAAWAPLASGVLSGKFTRPGEPDPTRIRHTGQDVSERDLRIAREVSAIELGFPTDTIESTRGFIYGPVHERVTQR